jgi:prepilin-type N-terminal cleavage/methylation domain-containing protein
MNLKKGFTLIELLVVIAIIGILSSVVLASLNSARTKGSDAGIRANLAGIRPQAEIYYDGAGNGSYGAAHSPTSATDCSIPAAGVFSDVTIRGMIAAATSTAGGLANSQSRCGSTTSSWAVAVPLRMTPTSYACVDSTGAAKTIAGALPATITVCP